MPSTREIIQSALGQHLVDEDQETVHLRLLPGLPREELHDLVQSLPVPPSDDVRDLLEFCSGVVDLQPGSDKWGPIYFCCHDAPVMLLQAATVQQFVIEILNMYVPPHKSLVDDVHEDRLFNVWKKNPGVIAQAEALTSPNP